MQTLKEASSNASNPGWRVTRLVVLRPDSEMQ